MCSSGSLCLCMCVCSSWGGVLGLHERWILYCISVGAFPSRCAKRPIGVCVVVPVVRTSSLDSSCLCRAKEVPSHFSKWSLDVCVCQICGTGRCLGSVAFVGTLGFTSGFALGFTSGFASGFACMFFRSPSLPRAWSPVSARALEAFRGIELGSRSTAPRFPAGA